MNKENYSIEELLKADSVTRWHTVSTVRTQSLAEHQWNVAILTQSIALALGLTDSDINQVVVEALTHDIDEIYTGDLPSPYKESLAAREALPESQEGGRYTYSGYPEDVRGRATGAAGDISKYIIRGADRIDAYQWARQYVNGRQRNYVVNDCWGRLQNFMQQAPEQLEVAMQQVLQELTY